MKDLKVHIFNATNATSKMYLNQSSITQLSESSFQSQIQKMISKILYIGRILLQAILLSIFLHFFGLPAIERFQAREVNKENDTFQNLFCINLFVGDGGAYNERHQGRVL